MSGKTEIKNFSGGMNKDVDFSLIKENQYYDAQNYKLIADEDSNGFILENAEGNSQWLDLSGITGLDDTYFLVGHCYIQPYLVLFYTTNDADREPSTATSKIVRVSLDKDKLQIADIIFDDSTKDPFLNFSTTYPIKAIGHYEADDLIKVYWTDGYNDVRWMNIMDENLSSYQTDMLNLTPDFPANINSSIRPYFKEYITGSMDCSAVQYAYRYYIPNGATTIWSPASAMVQVPRNDSQRGFVVSGGDVDENSGYGVSIDIDVSGSHYTKMDVVAIQYDTYNGVPTVRLFAERDITPSSTYTLTVNDVGNTISELVYEEYLIQTNTTFKAKDIAIKDNYLLAGNIREEKFDVDVDCRAYRYPASTTTTVYESNLTDYYTITSTGGWTASAGLGGGTGTDWGIPGTADAINKYNISNYTSTDDENTNTYIFQADGTTIGAEGLNVKVSLDTDVTDIIDALGTGVDTQWIAGSFLYEPGQRSWQRNEVYRIGIVFRNEKMQPSPAKWVCDFKMPSMYEDSTDFALTTSGAAPYERRRIGIQVEYTGDGTGWGDLDAKTFEIVVVPRESTDHSILAQGILQPTYYDSGNTLYFPFHYMETETIVDGNGSTGLSRLLSPEISFNKNLKFKDNDFIHYLGYFDHTSFNRTDSGVGTTNTTLYTYDKVFLHTSNGVTDFTGDKKIEVEDFSVVGYVTDEDYRTTIDGKTYKPYIEELATGAGMSGYCTTHGCLSLDTALTNFWEGSAYQVPLVNYKRDIFASQYGGPDYYSRQNNQYISVSDPYIPNSPYTGSIVESYEGDTFIDWFVYNNACTDILAAETDTSASVFLFPVETSISLSHRLDEGLHRNVGSKDALLVQEISGTHESAANYGVDTVARSWEQDTALYQYNPVYSQQSRAEFHLADNDQFDEVENYPTRIKRSELKINGEQLDSFTVFKPNNFIDLNGQYGPLNNLEVFNNNLYFWQNSGFGVASINTRSLIQDNLPGLLALGTGGILDRVDYISESIGNQNKFGIAKSRTGMYWVDNNKNEFFKFGEGLKSVSKLKGIQTWINDNGRIGDVKAVYDHKYNDVVFTITYSRVLDCYAAAVGDWATDFEWEPVTGIDTAKDYNIKINGTFQTDVILPQQTVITYDTGTIWTIDEDYAPHGTTSSDFYCSIDQDPNFTYTVTFNEIVDAFTSFNSFTPAKYIQLDTNFLSTNDYHDLYVHNTADASRATYYGTEYDSDLTLVFNKEFPYTKTWDSLKWHSESVDSDGVNQFKDTFDTVTIYNDYQHTGDRDLYYRGDSAPVTRPTEAVRRERTWSMSIPRNIVDTDVSSNPDITDSGNWDEGLEFKDRMRSKHIVVNYVYDNSNNYTFSVPFIGALYRTSRR